MKWIYDLSYRDLKKEINGCGMKEFVADQIFQWIYGKIVQEIDGWTNISRTNRDMLSGIFNASLDKYIKVNQDQEGTKKYLFELKDGHKIESVFMKEKHHYTFCISTQVGCALKCQFCATGGLGFKRNLTSGEILSQILTLKRDIGPYQGKLNLVFMGMGEPFLNYDHLKKALDILVADPGVGIFPRNITVSTAGILKGIKRFEMDFPNAKLSFSLNAPNSSLREQFMPVSKTERLEDILNYFRSFKRKHRITFEYILLKGLNDSLADARQLGRLLRGIPCKVNIIPLNENENIDFKAPARDVVEEFCEFLHRMGFTVIVRWSKGRDIQSACGQLAAEG